MGRTRKVKQHEAYSNALNDESFSKNYVTEYVPDEFLTSDDFQVVEQRRRHRKKSTGDFQDLLKSNSDLLKRELKSNAHSNFWLSHSISSEGETSSSETTTKVSGSSPSSEIKVLEKTEIKSEKAEIKAPANHQQTKRASKKKSSTSKRHEDDFEKILKEVEEIDKAGSKKNKGIKKSTMKKEAAVNTFREEKHMDELVNAYCMVEDGCKLSHGGNLKNNYDNKNTQNSKSPESNFERSHIQAKELDSKTTNNPADPPQIGQDSSENSDLSKALDKEEKDFLAEGSKEIINAIEVKETKMVHDELVCPKSGDPQAVPVKPNQKKKKKKRNERKDSTGLLSSSSSEYVASDTLMCQTNETTKLKDPAKLSESESSKRKKPSKKMLSQILDAVNRAKQEQQRRQQEEEHCQNLAKALEKQRLEELQQEQERKDRKKQKEKERREKLRSEGKLLSKSEKQSRARFLATLDIFRQQGINVPKIGDHKPRKRYYSSQSDTSERYKSESLSSEKDSSTDIPSSLESNGMWPFDFEKGIQPSCSEDSLHVAHSPLEDSSAYFPKDLPDDPPPRRLSKDLLSGDSTKRPNITPTPAKSKSKMDAFRAPVLCVLGHVDAGKTKLLDRIRGTRVGAGEAGGITQQVGATLLSREALKDLCGLSDMQVPGLLFIDTPGHAAFGSLRGRGAAICDMAILVVDIADGLQPQTIESLDLLKAGHVPYVIALNKVDRLYGWKSTPNSDIVTTLQNQSNQVQMELKSRSSNVVAQFAQQEVNVALFYENPDPSEFVNIVPVSASTGDGIRELLSLLVKTGQDQLGKQLRQSVLPRATVLEVKVTPGLGTTIDVILAGGRLQAGDTIVTAGQRSPIVTQIRSLLVPQKDLRKPYEERRCVEGSQGVKIAAKDLDKCIAGLPLFVVRDSNKLEETQNSMQLLINRSRNIIQTSERGVYVQASTLGSLEALVGHLELSGISYFAVKVGPVVKRDVVMASVMLEHEKQYACILAFDVKIERDAQELADSLGVKIFSGDIMYRVCDAYLVYWSEVEKEAALQCQQPIPKAEFSKMDNSHLVRHGTNENNLRSK